MSNKKKKKVVRDLILTTREVLILEEIVSKSHFTTTQVTMTIRPTDEHSWVVIQKPELLDLRQKLFDLAKWIRDQKHERRVLHV